MPRGRRQERRVARQGEDPDAPEIYQMREKLASIVDDFWIETNRGRRAFKVDGKAVRVRDTALTTPLRERWTLESDDVGEVKAQGNLVAHEYSFELEAARSQRHRNDGCEYGIPTASKSSRGKTRS